MVTNSVKMTNFGKEYDNKKIFSNLNMSIEKGDFVTILGPNGCGKSTLIKSIAGLIDYTGEINIIGSISLVSQNPNEMLLPWLSVKDNIIFPDNLQKIDCELLEKLLKITNLKDYETKYPYELSGGMQQILLIARALLHKSDIIILDEPSRSLDFFMRLKIQEKIFEMWKEYKPTIIMISHDVDEALFVSNTLVIFSDKPATIKKVLKSTLPEERNSNVMKTKEYGKLREEILYELLKK